jgi:hypothetical protein
MLTMRMSPRAVGDTHGTCVLGGPGPLSGSLGGSGVIRISRAGRLFLAIYALGTIAPPPLELRPLYRFTAGASAHDISEARMFQSAPLFGAMPAQRLRYAELHDR